MLVAEGRQIAFDEAHRLQSLPWNDLLALPEEDQTRSVVGPSGRRYTMKVGFDHSETGPEWGIPMTYGTVQVRPSGIFRFISFGEGVNVGKDPDPEFDYVVSEPTTYAGEIWKRIKLALLIPAIPLIILLLLVALPFLLLWMWIDEKRNGPIEEQLD